jgi:hypothetical protein
MARLPRPASSHQSSQARKRLAGRLLEERPLAGILVVVQAVAGSSPVAHLS